MKKWQGICVVVIMILGRMIFDSSQIKAQSVVLEEDNAGVGTELGQTSENYSLDSIMDTVGGFSTDGDNEIMHGYFLRDPVGVILNAFRAVPEKRAGSVGNNETIISKLEFRMPDADKDSVALEQIISSTTENLYITNEHGIYDSSESGKTAINLSNLDVGIYDVYVKGYSHLRKKVPNVQLQNGNNYLLLTAVESTTPPAMTAPDYYLLGGDVNVASDLDGSCGAIVGSCHNVDGGYSGDEIGDDKVNSIDMGILVTKLFYTDENNDEINLLKEDLNMDGKINSIDLGIAVTNILKTGGEI